MRRQFNNIPQTDNLIFYAPLKEGDTKDHISGNDINLTGNGTIAWDSQENAYRFQLNTSNTAPATVGFYNVDFTDRMSLAVSQEYTIFAKVKISNRNGGFPYIIGLGNFNSDTSYKPNINAETAGAPTVWSNAACIRYSNNSMYFVGANRTESNNSSHMSNPANWNNTNLCAKRVCLYFQRWSNEGSYQICAWIKDVMVFNRALTVQEISQL